MDDEVVDHTDETSVLTQQPTHLSISSSVSKNWRPSRALRPISSHFRHTLEYFRNIEQEHTSRHEQHTQDRHSEQLAAYPRLQRVLADDPTLHSPEQDSQTTLRPSLSSPDERSMSMPTESQREGIAESAMAMPPLSSSLPPIGRRVSPISSLSPSPYPSQYSLSSLSRPQSFSNTLVIAQKSVSFLLSEEDESVAGVKPRGMPSFFFSSSSDDRAAGGKGDRAHTARHVAPTASNFSIDSEFGIPRLLTQRVDSAGSRDLSLPTDEQPPRTARTAQPSSLPQRDAQREEMVMMQRAMTASSMQSMSSARSLRSPLLAKKRPPPPPLLSSLPSAKSCNSLARIPSYSYSVSYDAHSTANMRRNNSNYSKQKRKKSPRADLEAIAATVGETKSVSFHIISPPTEASHEDAASVRHTPRHSRHHYHRADHMLLSTFPHNKPVYRRVFAKHQAVRSGASLDLDLDTSSQERIEEEREGEEEHENTERVLPAPLSLCPHKALFSLLHSHSKAKDDENALSDEFMYEYDLAVVFPIDAGQQQGQSADTRFIMHTMLRAGLEVYPYLSSRQDSLIVLLRAPVQILKNFAQKTNFKLLANQEVLAATLARGNPHRRIASVKIKHDPKITPFKPCEHVYLRYQAENESALYQVARYENDPFSKLLRLKLTYRMLTSPKRLGGCNLAITTLLHQQKIRSIFPLHDPDDCLDLLTRCLRWNAVSWTTPTEELKEYLGEKIALFYVFHGHFSQSLLPIAVVGVACQVLVLYSNNFSHPSLPFYSVVVIVWAIWMLSRWKLKQSTLALQWGMTDFVDQQVERPEFFGELHVNSFIDGREMLYFSRRDFRRRVARSLATIFSLLLLVLGVISAIYVLKFSLQSHLGLFVSGIASLLNVSQIMLFNMVYQKIAVHLTDKENHRTDTEYENALILKVFVSQFINSYASLFFLAFVAAYLPRPVTLDNSNSSDLGQCGDKTCMRPMAITLGIIIISRAITKNAFDILLPHAQVLWRVYCETGSFSFRGLSPPEQQFLLMEYDPVLESVKKYADVAVQYGYTVLFAAALPIAPLLTLIHNHIKAKTMAWKVLTYYKRPVPGGAQGIESWQLIFTVISIIAVVTNAAILSFTMTTLNHMFTVSDRVWVFVLFQWVMLFLQYLTSILVPEESEFVQIQLSRIAAITQKVVDKFEDEDYDARSFNDYASDEDDEDHEDEDHKNSSNNNNNDSSCGAMGSADRDKPTRNNSSQNKFSPDFPRETSKGSSARRSDYWSSLGSMFIGSIGSSVDENDVAPDIENQRLALEQETEIGRDDSEGAHTTHSNGLKRAQSFYAPTKETRGWWPSSFLLKAASMDKLPRKLSNHSESHKAPRKLPKKKKVYRRRVLNPAMEALHLSALPIFEYPQTNHSKAWNAPLTQDGVGDESEFEILDLEIW